MNICTYIEQLVETFNRAGLCFAHGTNNAVDEAVYLVYGSLGIDYDEDYRTLERILSDTELDRLNARVASRVGERVPVAYLVGEAWFCGRPFNCDQRALIPRSPIGELIGNSFQPLLKSPPARILDMCTGGGCIGISCALEFPDAEVDLADISPACLELAASNIGRHGTSDRVKTIESDLFDNIQGVYDLIVANPPYVSTAEVNSLAPEFQHEPRLGLESGEAGLDIPLTILRQAEEYLSASGVLVMEVGYSAAALQERLPDLPLLWLEFEHGGDGVMGITSRELRQYREKLN
ncbi:MAG: 50S ribosomal protein L3 N(5)-glutamine methyltransferase [Gammaproteobacteria bacterium]